MEPDQSLWAEEADNPIEQSGSDSAQYKSLSSSQRKPDRVSHDHGLWSDEERESQPAVSENEEAAPRTKSSSKTSRRSLTANSFMIDSTDAASTDFLWMLYCQINDSAKFRRFAEFHRKNDMRMRELYRDVLEHRTVGSRADNQVRDQKKQTLGDLRRRRSEALRDDVNFLVSTISASISKSLWPTENVERFCQRLDKISTRQDMMAGYRPELLKKHKSGLFESWVEAGKPEPPPWLVPSTVAVEGQNAANPFSESTSPPPAVPVDSFDEYPIFNDDQEPTSFSRNNSLTFPPSQVLDEEYEGGVRGKEVVQQVSAITAAEIEALNKAKEDARQRRLARIAAANDFH